MGNLCGKVDHDDAPPARRAGGRTLGSAPGAAPAGPRTAPVPAHVGGPPRTLGAGGGGGGGGEDDAGAGASATADARRKAAAAAEARNAAKAKGKLGSQLDAQRRASRKDTLKKASEDEVRQRELDAAARAAVCD